MPTLSRWCVRAALLYLVFGFTLGGLLLSAKAGAADLRMWVWLPAHVDALIVGWMIQLAMGVAFWILPRRRIVGRGRTELAWASFVLLNTGLTFSVGFSWLHYWLPNWEWLHEAFPLGLVMQVLAVAVFAGYAWARILPTITLTNSQPHS